MANLTDTTLAEIISFAICAIVILSIWAIGKKYED
jgi:hypothetical protein